MQIEKALHPHRGLLGALDAEWNAAMGDAFRQLNIEVADLDPKRLEELSPLGSHHTTGKKCLIIGLNGPGGVGKGTVTGALRLPRVVNTTTRQPRHGEENGIHYHFVTEARFEELREANEIVTAKLRPGRGWYAIERRSLDVALANHSHVLVEENPETLHELAQYLQKNGVEHSMVTAFLLPPAPILHTLAQRVAGRCLDGGDPLTFEVVNSTLGERQILEFMSAVTLRQDLRLDFVVNDNVDRVAAILRERYAIP